MKSHCEICGKTYPPKGRMPNKNEVGAIIEEYDEKRKITVYRCPKHKIKCQ